MRRLEVRIVWGMLVAVTLSSCGTVPQSFPMQPVSPIPGESVNVDQIVILTDVSGSTWSPVFSEEKGLIQSFVQAMPRGSYEAALRSFGGTEEGQWMRNALMPFDRKTLTRQADTLSFIGKLTTLGMALNDLTPEFRKKKGRGVIVIFSDGKTVRSEAELLEAAQRLVSAHWGDLCIHTVHIGNDPKGRAKLAALSGASGCGRAWLGEHVNSESGMQDLVKSIFFSGVPDSDEDGVPDYRDECPGTEKGTPVDENGCPRDSDGDGVPDFLDKCPGTPKGATIDARGCWVIRDLQFDFDKYTIKPEFEHLIADVAKVLKQNPGIRIRVDGHTDSAGSYAHNQKLSGRRARSVRHALIAQGIVGNQIESQGFGEGLPIAPNTSPENMYLNRRVEITVLQ